MTACLLQLSAQREASFNVLGNMTEIGDIFSVSISYKTTWYITFATQLF